MMVHVYILHYGNGQIYHAEVEDNIVYNKDINLMKYLGMNEDECLFMLVDEPLPIIDIKPLER